MISSARAYQEKTSYDRHAMGGHPMDWSNQPDPFKRYPGVQGISLPGDPSFPEKRFSEILLGEGEAGPSKTPTLEQVARSLLLSYAHTARARQAGGDFYYRSAPSAGALYPCEIYLGVRRIPGLPPGLYHYAVGEHALIPLRPDAILSDDEMALEPFPGRPVDLVFFITVIFFRSSWKYRDRAYRYHLLDTGHLTEGLALSLKGNGLAFRVEEDFDDEAVNAYLGLDTEREACLCVVRVPGAGVAPVTDTTPPRREWSPVPPSSPVASREVGYPSIQEIHRLTSSVGRSSTGEGGATGRVGLEPGPARGFRQPEAWPEVTDWVQTVWSRRSKRNFVPQEVAGEQTGALLACLETPGGEKGRGTVDSRGTLCVGLLAGPKVQGLDAGFYLLDSLGSSLRPVVSGNFLADMSRACLDQAWLAYGALHFVFLTHFPWLESHWGPRGYRYAMMSAGRMGQRLYLAATAMGLGCCGIGAFYDGEASLLLGLNEDSRLLYLVAVGPVKK
jgi:SagB-type dehydrogenase family enzyme